MDKIAMPKEIIVIDLATDLSEDPIVPVAIVEQECPGILLSVKRFNIVDLWSIRNRQKKY